jgi:hypothetical protein
LFERKNIPSLISIFPLFTPFHNAKR